MMHLGSSGCRHETQEASTLARNRPHYVLVATRSIPNCLWRVKPIDIMDEVPPAEPHLIPFGEDPNENKDTLAGCNLQTEHPERGEPSDSAGKIEGNVVLESYFYQLTGELVNCKCITNRNLRVLSIFGQLNLITLDGVENLANLSELWVVECGLEEANDVNYCKNLRKLYLYSNNLKDIPEVNNLKNLSTLWLAGNQIKSLRKLQEAQEVKDLNVANNLITDLSPLKGHSKLEVLNVAGNPLKNLQSVEPLAYLPKLRKLLIADPLYNVTPLISSINYRAYVISRLDHLRVLDNLLIEFEERDQAETYFTRKCRYYKILLNNALNKVFAESQKRMNQSYSSLRNLKNALFNNSLNETKEKNKVLQDECLQRKKALEAACFLWESQHNKWNELLEKDYEITYNLLELEMKYYGNVNFIDQTKDVYLVHTVKTRMETFLCPYVKRNTTLKSIAIDKVIQIIRIQNRYFYEFEGVKEVICGDVTSEQFLMLDVPSFRANSSNQWPLDFLKCYCSSADNDHIDCTLTNSLAIVDCNLLKSHAFHSSVIVGKERQAVRKAAILSHISGENQLEVCSREEVLRNHLAVSEESSDNCYYCTMHQTTLSSQVIPAFMVVYHYNYPSEKGETEMDLYLNFQKNVSAAICPKIKTNNWAQLRELNISKMSIQSFGLMQAMPNIQVLDVSCNKIRNLYEISSIFPNLILLVASFNEIQSITSMKDMKCLEELDLKWNRLNKFIATLQYLKKTCTSLHNLDLGHNCFCDLHDTKHAELFLNRLLPGLRKYNGEWLDRKENPITYHFSPKDFLTIVLTDKVRKEIKKGRKLLWSGALCSSNSVRSHVTVDSNGFPECIYLHRENTMHEFRVDVNKESLKWMSVTRNQLTKMNFLNQYANLEEVDLSFNALQSITDTFHDLKKLTKLNLTCNYLTSLEPFKNCGLTNLKVLNVSDNFLKTFQGVESIVNIEELYASANEIKKWESLDFIKYLKSLKIIDVSLNPVDDAQMLRKYLIFHGSKLEYINGSPIKDDEIIEANESLSGVLDKDYLFKIYKPHQIDALAELTVRKVGLRKVSLWDLDTRKITSVNLESNSLTTFSGLNSLRNLKYLCLTNNQITCFGPTKKVFDSLEVLYLNFNNLSSLVPLEFEQFPKLTTLFLQDNQLTSVEGLQESRRLQFLVLDRNKIVNISIEDLNHLSNLKELYVESNLIKDLSFAKSLINLKRLFLAHNRIQEKESIESLENLQKLRDLTIIGNPICRFNMHLPLILSTLPKLQYLDGHLVEEKSEYSLKKLEA